VTRPGAALPALAAVLALSVILRGELLAAQQSAGAQPDVPVQLGVAVRPETVTVGQPFQVVVRVRSAPGARIAFPAGPDSSLPVEAIDPPAVRAAPDSAGAEETAVYRLVAWDTGARGANLGDVVVTLGGEERRVSLAGVRVLVRSVLPADTALHVPKPARDVIAAARPWWHWVAAGLLALALLGLLVWWWLRRRRRAPAATPLDPLAYAEREFVRIEALGLLDAGERGRYVALVVEVVRHYLDGRIDGARTSLTSVELLDFLRRHPEVPVERLARLLAESDLIKFARRPVTAERARELGREARTIVSEVDRALSAQAAAGAMPEAA
jgi:hypothetical protein